MCSLLVDEVWKWPKTELHVHIEGTLSPELYWKLLQKHYFSSSSKRVVSLEYQSGNLKSFKRPPSQDAQLHDNLKQDTADDSELKESASGGACTDSNKCTSSSSAKDNSSGINNLTPCLPFSSLEEVTAAYDKLTDLNSFLRLYYANMDVLRDQEDFFELTWNYMQRAHRMNVVHVEVFFDPSAHTKRGVSFGMVVNGISSALARAQRELQITSCLMMCFVRDHKDGEVEAFRVLAQSLPFRHLISGVGLDSDEINYPPSLFARVFAEAKLYGYHCVAHGGHDGPAVPYVSELVDCLAVERIDHGVTVMSEPRLVAHLRKYQIPLTVCPVSNVKIGPFGPGPGLERHPIKQMMDSGLLVCVNSDDPAYLQCYLNDVWREVITQFGFDRETVKRLVCNGFRASFLPSSLKNKWIETVNSL